MLACVAAALVASSSVQIWIADESEKVLPDATPRRAKEPARIRFSAAGGECIGAQIVVRSEKGVKALSASAQPLVSAEERALPATGGARRPEHPTARVSLDVMRVATILLARPTEPEGRAGEWPDALIPVRDPLFGQTRRAFPIDVGAGRAQAIFVEACPARGLSGTRGARFSSTIQLGWIDDSSGAKLAGARVPVELKMRGFDLPATPALVTAFGFSGYSAAKGHKRGPEANPELTRAYDTIALRRGITLFGGTQNTPPYQAHGDEVKIDWKVYDDEVAPFLDGTPLPDGARWTSVELREPKTLTRGQRRSWRRAWMSHFQERGWLDRLFAYVEDEPAAKDFARVEQHARELREDAPSIRRLVTTAWSDQLPSIDVWVPLLNCLGEGSPNCPRPVARSRYRDAEAKGAWVWWYQSCMSHGCDPSGVVLPQHRAAFTGWPDYVIDAPATAARAMGALAFANGIAGELYYDVVYSYDFSDPWELQYGFGGNGDGNLYYPGTPARIGGDRDVPVETLRIVQIQRGIQDYEYLALCSKMGDAKLAGEEARSLAPAIRRFSRDPKAYASMRDRIGARIEVLNAERRKGSGEKVGLGGR